jgi:hypothetical protein
MPDEKSADEVHRRMAAETFNATWDYLDKAMRSSEDNDMMVHAAHASRYHWARVGTPLEFERGDWQLSRVYATLGKGTEALHYAKHCLDTCMDNEIGDFDLAFAFEAMARAHAVLEQWDRSQVYLENARKAAEAIAKEEDRKYLLGELDSVPMSP